MRDTIKITIKASDLRPAYGHQARPTGCGPHKNRRKDKKARRREDRRLTRDE